jgi:hypothetical protein
MRVQVQCTLLRQPGGTAEFAGNVVQPPTAEMQVSLIDIHRLQPGHDHPDDLESGLVDIGRCHVDADDIGHVRPNPVQRGAQIGERVSGRRVVQIFESQELGRLCQELAAAAKT